MQDPTTIPGHEHDLVYVLSASDASLVQAFDSARFRGEVQASALAVDNVMTDDLTT